MGRKKKVVEPETKIDIDTEIDKAIASESLKEAEQSTISLLPTDLGRTDLNTMAAKINELIERANQ